MYVYESNEQSEKIISIFWVEELSFLLTFFAAIVL